MLVILDRDGVINEDSPDYIKCPDEWHPIPGSLEAIAKLKKAGCTVVIATNQSGLARGLFTEKSLETIHEKLHNALLALGAQVDGIYICPHSPEDQCGCRKPKPGLFNAIQKSFPNDSRILAIGDSLRDIQAAEQLEIETALVLTGNGKKTLQQLGDRSIRVYANLAAAVDDIVTLCV